MAGNMAVNFKLLGPPYVPMFHIKYQELRL
jgi:hypothetical protein